MTFQVPFIISCSIAIVFFTCWVALRIISSFQLDYLITTTKDISPGRISNSTNLDNKWIYIITPTYRRSTQLPDLTRIAESLSHVKKLKWIVVEDAESLNHRVIDLLYRKYRRSGLDSAYLAIPSNPKDKCRGNTQRDVGLKWILHHAWPRKNQTSNWVKKNYQMIQSLNIRLEALNNQTSERIYNINHETGHLKNVEFTKFLSHTPVQNTSYSIPSESKLNDLPLFIPHLMKNQLPQDQPFLLNTTDIPNFKFPHYFSEKYEEDLIDNSGIIYFGDDDNSYDSDLFNEIRKIEGIGLFPVGLIGNTKLSTPIVNNKDEILGFYDGWVGGLGRLYPVDMFKFFLNGILLQAGVAVSLEYLYLKNTSESYWDVPLCTKSSQAETNWLSKFGSPMENILDAVVHNASRIFVWHTKTVKQDPPKDIPNILRNGTNLEALNQWIV